MNRGDLHKSTDALHGPLLALGGLLVVFGVVLLLFLGVMVYSVIMAPEDVRIVQFVLEHVRAGDRALFGKMTDPQTMQTVDFELNWSESVRTMSFIFLGVALLGVLSGIAKVILSGGIGLINLAVKSRPDGQGERIVK